MVELISISLVELVKRWEFLKLKIIFTTFDRQVPIVEFFIRKSIMAFEVNGDCDIVRSRGGMYFSPEEELISICHLGQTNQGQF